MTETTTESEQLVTQYITIWNEREFSKLSDVIAESFTLTSPTAGTVQGRDSVEAHARAIVDGFSDYQVTVHEMLMTESTLSGLTTVNSTVSRRLGRRSRSEEWRSSSSKTVNCEKNAHISTDTTS